MSRLAGTELPQANRLERVVARVRAAVLDDAAWHAKDERDLAYYTSAAQILGWFDREGEPTPFGAAVARADTEPEALAHAFVALERSAAGSRWVTHAGAPLAELDVSSAEAFLLAHSDLSPTTIERRASTLRQWLQTLQPIARDHADLIDAVRTFYRDEGLPPQVRAFLAGPLDAVVPARLVNWAASRGVHTFEALLQHAPDDMLRERNLGKKTLRDTDALITDATGLTWAELHARLANTDANAKSPSAPPRAWTWAVCRDHCPEPLRTFPLERIALPTRMRTFCQREGITTLGTLLSWTLPELHAQKGVGRGSVQQALAAIRELIDRTRAGEDVTARPSLDDVPSLRALFKAELGDLEPVERLVLTRRAGLHGGDIPTLEDLGATLGVSRERVRQLEKRGCERLATRWWAGQLQERIEAALPEGVRPLTALPDADPFFADIEELSGVLDFLLHRVLGDVARVFTFPDTDETLLVTTPPRDIRDALQRMQQSANALVFPVPLAAVLAIADHHAPRGLADHFREHLEAQLMVTGDTVTGIGDTVANRVLRYLEEAAGPVPVSELRDALGRGKLPEAVIYVARGVVALPKHVPDFHLWSRRLVPLSIALMSADPGRQWSVLELLDAVSEQAQLPDWLGHWHLASMLRLSGKVRYLGRLQVALDHDDAPEERAHIHDIGVEVLRAAGTPLPLETLCARIQARRGVRDSTLHMMVLKAPFLRVDAGRYGLLDRDLPGGQEAIADATEVLEEELEARQRGLGPAEAKALVEDLSADHARWTLEMVKTVARHAGSFRLNRSGGLGLSAWDDERLPTRRGTLAALLEKGEGRTPVEGAMDALEERFGSRPSRVSLTNLASALGARLRGDEILREELIIQTAPPPPPELPDPSSLPGFPPGARPHFQAYLAEPIEDFGALRQQATDYVAEFERAHRDNEFIDPEEARALARASAALIDAAQSAPVATQRLVWAAVRYFVSREDAEKDFSIGGLDDDIAVMNAVAAHLGREDVHIRLS